MSPHSLFLALLWRTTVAYIVLALLFVLCGATLYALGIDVPPREIAATAGFIKLKPTLAYVAFASLLLFAEFFLRINLVRLIAGAKLNIATPAWHQYLVGLSVVLMTLAGLNLVVAATASVEIWITYKLFGALTLLLAGIYFLAIRMSKNATYGI